MALFFFLLMALYVLVDLCIWFLAFLSSAGNTPIIASDDVLDPIFEEEMFPVQFADWG